MDADDWNSEETKDSKGGKETWFRKRINEEEVLQKVFTSSAV